MKRMMVMMAAVLMLGVGPVCADDWPLYFDDGIAAQSDIYTWKGGAATFDGTYTDYTSPEGSKSFKTDCNDWAGWGIFFTDGPHDLSQRTASSLKFWVKTSVDLTVEMQDTKGKGGQFISFYGWNGKNTWQPIEIPVPDFLVDTASLKSPFMITAGKAAGFQVDFVRWSAPSRFIIASVPPKTADAGQVYRYEVKTWSPEEKTVAFRLTQKPGGMTIDTQTGVILWSPTLSQVGIHTVGIEAKDADGNIDKQVYELEVVNRDVDITLPEPGSTLSSSTVTFKWTGNNKSVDEYWLLVGTAPDKGDLFNASKKLLSSQQVTKIPLKGEKIYVDLWFNISGDWDVVRAEYFTFDARPQMISPVAGSTLNNLSQTFQWTTNSDITDLWVSVGTKSGGSDIYPWTRLAPTVKSLAVPNIPLTGGLVYFELWYSAYSQWDVLKANFKTENQGLVRLTAPVPGSILTADTVTFEWNPFPAGTTRIWVAVGTSRGGDELFSWTEIQTDKTFLTVSGIPMTGESVYFEMWYREQGKWNRVLKADFLTENKKTAIVSPAPNSILSTATVTFLWGGYLPGTTEAWLAVGTKPGGTQILNWSQVFPSLSRTVSGIVLEGGAVYFEMWSKASGKWLSLKAVYTVDDQRAGVVKLTSPLPGTVLTSSSVTFQWTNLTGVTEVWLAVGTSQGGTQILNWTQIAPNFSKTVNNIPLTGNPVYFEMWYSTVDGTWVPVKTVYQTIKP